MLRAAQTLVRLALIWSWLITTIPIALADATTGQQAFDKGDYVRAAAEWQGAADKGDADAQLGLGKVYEFGLGDLAQDYKRADLWYRKAADQNNVEAQYRLALIWAVGADGFSPDLPEAYKWLSLVLDSKGVWGARAAELKPQFDRLVRPTAQTEGKQRAAAWREAHTVKPSQPPAVAAAPPVAVPAPTPLPSSKCAGWPFPTLPCTEEFPAFPGAKPQQVVVPPIPAQNAVRAPGSASATPAPLRSTPGPFGPAGAGLHDKTLVQLDCPSITASAPPPCRAFAELNSMRAIGLLSDGNLVLRLPDGITQLHQGDLIKVEVRAPEYPVNLRIDYFSLSGQVLHLWPNSDETEANLLAHASHVYGEPGAHKVWAAGGAPFGIELITVIATATALDLGGKQRPVEQAADYLREVQAALGRSRPTAGMPNIIAMLPVHTVPH